MSGRHCRSRRCVHPRLCSPLRRVLLRISRRHPSKWRPVAGALSPVADGHLGSWGALRSGACGSTISMGLTTWLSPCRVPAGIEWPSDGTEQRCSRLGLISCSLRLGYAAQVWTVGSLLVAYDSSSTGWRSRRAVEDKVCAGVRRISSAPPLCAPARVIPGRTLLEAEVSGWLPLLPSISLYADCR